MIESSCGRIRNRRYSRLARARQGAIEVKDRRSGRFLVITDEGGLPPPGTQIRFHVEQTGWSPIRRTG